MLWVTISNHLKISEVYTPADQNGLQIQAGSSCRLPPPGLHLKSRRINNLFFCIWHEDEAFHIEDVEDNIIMSISIFQLRWFIETVKELNQNSEEDSIYKNEKVENGRVEISKFRTKSGRVLRCNVWPHTGERSFIHIPVGEDKLR